MRSAVGARGRRWRAWRQRCNATVLRLIDHHFDRGYRRAKCEVFKEMPARILELGPGAGANFRYYPEGGHVVAIEPNLHAHPVLRQAARRGGLKLSLVVGEAERIPQASASVDLVVGTLLLCSVRDPEAVLREVLRVLRPGGRFLAIEHVPAPVGSVQRACQARLAGIWRMLFDGCELCRDTERLLGGAGFATVVIERLTLPTFVLPIRSQIVVRCTR